MPTLAMEAHSAAIDATVDAALSEAGVSAADLAAVAVTVGPGLVMCLQASVSMILPGLLIIEGSFSPQGDQNCFPVTYSYPHGDSFQVGVQKAREVAAQHQLPIVAVHHMEAHALMARAAAARLSSSSSDGGSSGARPEFPFLALLVSGGHNLLLLVHGVGDYQILGSTVDDAVGEWSAGRVTCWPADHLLARRKDWKVHLDSAVREFDQTGACNGQISDMIALAFCIHDGGCNSEL